MRRYTKSKSSAVVILGKMEEQNLLRIADLLEQRTDDIVEAWRQAVADATRKNLDEAALTDSMAELLREMADTLRHGSGDHAHEHRFRRGPITHGAQRVKVGFGIEEVITEYNILRDVLQDQAEGSGLNLTGETGHIINRVLNAAMILSVRAYVNERNAETRRIKQERLSFMMHDLKTPLSAIASAASILEMHTPSERQGNIDVLQIIRRNAERMNKLLMRVIRDESYISNEPVVECREFDLSKMVSGLFADMKPLADKSQTELRNEVAAGTTINADPALLTEVLQNLISNAIRFTECGFVSVGAQYKDGGIECWVRDSGKGIEPDRIHRIFDKFETESADGHGLGLAIVKKIIEAHGGAIQVQSDPGAGACFYFTIPQPLPDTCSNRLASI
jgi:signal transduction histidine kinase